MLIRDPELGWKAFEKALWNQASLAGAILVCLALLTWVINVLVLVPLWKMADQLRNFRPPWSPVTAPQLSHGARPGEVGLVAREINSLIRSIALAEEEAKILNLFASHKILSPVHTLNTEQPENKHVQKLAVAIETLETMTNATSADAGAYGEVTLRAEAEHFVSARDPGGKPVHGPFLVTGPSHAWCIAKVTTLREAIENVVANAARYRTPGTPIVFRLDDTPEWALLYIENEGPSIPAHKLETIFKLGHTTDRGTGHRGQGLYLSRSYLRMLGGDLTAMPREDGASFEFRIPRIHRA